jgi:hypothetical protein
MEGYVTVWLERREFEWYLRGDNCGGLLWASHSHVIQVHVLKSKIELRDDRDGKVKINQE